MMLSLLGSLLGFGTSFLPSLMSYFQDRQDKAHELAMMEQQREQQIALGELQIKHVNVEADIAETAALLKHDSGLNRRASQWCVNLAASVRPVITYLLFIEFATLTFMVAFGMIDNDMYRMIWNNEFQAIWAAVVSFWFGARTMARRQQT